jgi:hypothetical protein
MLVGQALAEGQLRLSGLSFFDPEGQVGGTGWGLEKLLNLLGQTIFPPAPVVLPSGMTVPRSSPGFIRLLKGALR